MSSSQQPTNYDLTLETVSGISYYISRYLLEMYGILAIFTARKGGVSREPYSSMNLAFHVGDDRKPILKNRELVCSLFDLDFRRMVCAEQVHGTKVAIVGKHDIGKGALSLESAVGDVDALITDQPLTPLTLFFADCVPIILVEPEKRVVSVTHAGWRGVYGNIVGNVIKSMASSRSELAARLLAFIGPSIGDCCYQVGGDLIRMFSQRFANSKNWLHGDRIDLREIVRVQLIESGMASPNIYICEGCCTSCHNEVFFSHRADGGTTGRQAAIAAILRKPIAK